jgi:hypothetical protein
VLLGAGAGGRLVKRDRVCLDLFSLGLFSAITEKLRVTASDG